VDGSVISKVGGDVANTTNSDTEEGLSPEPRSEGLGDKKVQERRKGATLANPGLPSQQGGFNTIDMGGGTCVVEKDAGPIDHTRGGTHRGHHPENELTVKSVIGFGYVNEYMCPSCTIGN
jgi:hypothetical protein